MGKGHNGLAQQKGKGLKRREAKVWAVAWAVVAALGLWHLGDVRAGALESGDGWLVGNYLALFALAAVFGGVAGYLFFCKKQWRIENTFAICALVLGMCYLLVLPPLSAPDEVSHYISAYKLSNQLLGKPGTDQSGHVYVRSQDLFIEDLNLDGDGREVLGQKLTEATYAQYHGKGIFQPVKLPGQKAVPSSSLAPNQMAVSRQIPVSTTPLAYLPQAIGFALARLLGLNSFGLLWAGRLMNLLFYVAVTYLAIRRLPFGKMVLFGVALLPMTLHLSGSLSYDVMIMALSWYFTAHCLFLAYEAKKVRLVDVAVLALVIGVLGPCKMVYAVVLGLCLLIPVKKFGGWKPWLGSACLVLGVLALSMVLVNSQVLAVYTADSHDYVGWAKEAGYSLSQVLHRPGLLFTMFYNTVVWQAQQYHLTMIGGSLGNLDPVLDVPYVVLVFLTGALLVLAFRKPGDRIWFSKGQRRWIWFLVLACTGAIFLSMLVAWTPVSSKVISGVQGRYFLPLLPLVLMAVKNDYLVLTKDSRPTVLYLMCCANLYAVLRLCSVVSMRL